MTIEITTEDLKVMQEGTERFGAFAMATKTDTGQTVFLRVQGPARRRRVQGHRVDGPEAATAATQEQ